MKRHVMTMLAVTLTWPVAAVAQGGGTMTAAPLATPQAGGGGRGGVVAGAVESKITTGRPYSAEAVTERVQVLGDGNRISTRSVTKIYRDTEGRTRREMYTSDGTLRSIAISDPVARVSYTLDPEKKVAFKTGGNVVAPRIAPAGAVGFGGGPGEARVFTTQPAPAAVAGGGGGGGRGGAVMMRTPAPDNPNVRKEDLGAQNLEGVAATGTRTTTVIPAGEIGNALEIRVVSEQWFSDDIQALVMTRHADPRSGENIYRLRNILRAEPDPSLFMVPADYTIQERGIRRPQ